MASIAGYGGWTSGSNEANLVSFSKQNVLSQRGRKIQEVRRVSVQGELQGTAAQLITAANNIIEAFKQDGSDFVYAVGGTEAHSLRNSGDCVSGVKVVSTSFPRGDAAELATKRTYSFTLQGTYDACNDDLVFWNESVEVIGTGGPWWIVVNEMAGIQSNGGPLGYVLAATTAVEYVQRGRAVGYRNYPAPPGPVNPSGEFVHRRRITKSSARQVGNGLRFYPVSWYYNMARDVNVFGQAEFPPSSK